MTVGALCTIAGVCIATYTKPLSGFGRRKTKFAFCGNNIHKLSVNIYICLTFFFIPNTNYVIISSGLRNNSACSPNPVAVTVLGYVGKESNFVSTVFASVFGTNKEACTATFVSSKEFCFTVGNSSVIINLEKAFQCMTVGKFFLEVIVL